MTEKKTDTEFDEKMEVAEVEAKRTDNGAAYVFRFRKPFEYEGRTFEELHFDFDSLTGKDSQAIFNELKAKGRNVFPNIAWSDAAYATLFAAKCCQEKLGSDAFLAMPASDYNRIIARTSSFLMREAL